MLRIPCVFTPSFGMCMFEMAMGMEPWPDMSNEDVLKQLHGGLSMFETQEVEDAARAKRRTWCEQILRGEDEERLQEASDQDVVFHSLKKQLCDLDPTKRPPLHEVYHSLKTHLREMRGKDAGQAL